MARDYRTLKLEILAETKQFVDDMKKGEKQVETFGDKAKNMGKVAAAAFAAAAAAAAAYAGKLAIDGVKAAIEDAAAQERLKTALQNVIGASDEAVASTEEYISNMSLAYGVADDQLRPAYQRLATATGSLQQANTGLALAMNIAAGTGKSVEAVSNALAKAYEGNLSSLGRLGVGMSAAEMKTLGLEGTLTKLSETFRDQASIQANTFQGQMARLQVRMDEAKETIGFALLPILEKLLNFFNQNIGPATDALREKFEPLRKAIADNKDEIESLWNFTKTYLVPLIGGALKLGLSGIIESFKAVINIVSGAVKVIKELYQGWKDLIELLKNNPITRFFQGINPFGQAGFAQAGFTQAGAQSRPDMFGGAVVAPFLGDAIGSAVEEALAPIYGPGFRTNFVSGLNINEKRLIDQFIKSGEAARGGSRLVSTREGIDLNEVVQNILTAEAVYQQSRLNAQQARQFVINVNAPSIIDEEGFSRAVVDALNSSNDRSGVLSNLNL